MHINLSRFRVYPLTILLTSLVGSMFSPVYAIEKPYQQDFVITAYYSPLPDQCCYFRGSYEEEIAFNGNGIKGADGTKVYAGMLAAPPSYDFGTIIDLPGVGVGAVHDRGGRIIEWGDEGHRIDIWMGTGDEGLARALEWGVRHVRGTVYPLGTKAPAESLNIKTVPSDTSKLGGLIKEDSTLAMLGVKAGDESFDVRLLQQSLTELGYLDHAATGLFGFATQDALRRFQSEYGVKGDGSLVDDHTNAALISAKALKDTRLPELAVGLRRGRRGQDVRQAQKLLRYLGYYKGRTDGKFAASLHDAAVAFQLSAGIVKNASQDGAGVIGKQTKAAILQAWKIKQIKGEIPIALLRMQIAKSVHDQGISGKTLTQGERGPGVLAFQKFLADGGLLKKDEIGGYFGQKTYEALVQYQVAKGIIDSADQKGAGVFGPATRKVMMNEAIEDGVKRARAGIL